MFDGIGWAGEVSDVLQYLAGCGVEDLHIIAKERRRDEQIAVGEYGVSSAERCSGRGGPLIVRNGGVGSVTVAAHDEQVANPGSAVGADGDTARKSESDLTEHVDVALRRQPDDLIVCPCSEEQPIVGIEGQVVDGAVDLGEHLEVAG